MEPQRRDRVRVAIRRVLRASRHWPLYTQLLVAGSLILVASVVFGALRGDGPSAVVEPVPVVVTTGTASVSSSEPSSSSVTEPIPDTTDLASSSTAPPAPTTTSAPQPTTSAGEPTSTPAAAPTSVTGGSALALDVLRSIPIEREHPDGYDRDKFLVWADLDGDGCDTRQEVLRAESLEPVQSDPMGCPVLAGRWTSVYDGVTTGDPSELDIDHVVALKEAWDSGAWAWTPVQRIAFANDLTDPRTLVAVSASSNRSKGDRDPSNWLPPAEDPCRYVADWVAIKARWGLSMDQSEWGRIKNLLNGPCVGTRLDP